MRWLEQLSWPEEHDSAAPVLWIELLTSFRLTTKCPIPLQLPTQQGVYLTPGIHTIHSMPCLSLGAEACSFQNALKSLALILDQKLVPWHLGKTKCDTIPIFGFHLHASGLLLRPSFPHSQEVRVCLYKYLTSQKGKPSTSSKLDLPSERIPPEPEDVSQSAGSKRCQFHESQTVIFSVCFFWSFGGSALPWFFSVPGFSPDPSGQFSHISGCKDIRAEAGLFATSWQSCLETRIVG